MQCRLPRRSESLPDNSESSIFRVRYPLGDLRRAGPLLLFYLFVRGSCGAGALGHAVHAYGRPSRP